MVVLEPGSAYTQPVWRAAGTLPLGLILGLAGEKPRGVRAVQPGATSSVSVRLREAWPEAVSNHNIF